MENISCPLCDSYKTSFITEAEDAVYPTGERFTLVRCSNCGLVYLNPRPTIDEIGRYYPANNYYAYARRLQAGPDDMTWRQRRTGQARRISALMPPGRLLDVGCGDGAFLEEMQCLGWEVHGVELNPDAARFARDALNIDVRAGDFLRLDWPKVSFDLITMLETLEHLHRPRQAMGKVHSLLRPQGKLALSVPNINSLEFSIYGKYWVALEPPRHLSFFSPQTLERLLEETGFFVECLQSSSGTEGLTRSAWLLVRNRLSRRPNGIIGSRPYLHRSWRRTVHRLLDFLIRPLGWVLSRLQLGPGLFAVATKVL